MPESTIHPLIIVLAADSGGGAALAGAFSGHPQVHGIDDGGFWAGLLSLFDGAGEHAEGQPPAEEGGMLAAAFRFIDGEVAAGLDAPARSAITDSLARLPASRGDEQTLREHMLALWDQVTRGLVAAVGKPGLAWHATGASRQAASLAELLPDARIVHLITDPRTLAARAGGGGDGGTIRQLAEDWLADVASPLWLARTHPERVVKLCYEELVEDPAGRLGPLCGWLQTASAPEPMAAAFRAAPEPGGKTSPDLLDPFQLIELESALEPVLALLGYTPASDFGTVARLRFEAERYERARAEADSLRERLRLLEPGLGDPRVPARHGASEDSWRFELARLRREVARYEDLAEELQLLRTRLQEQAPLDIETLRWKAKRYDQIRAAASPLLRLRRRRARRSL